MKFSYETIKKLIPGLKLSGHELADLLTMRAFETVIDREYVIDPTITVVKIIKLDPHPNADRLRLATVTDGIKEVRVVCGAPNIEVGQVVPYAGVGAKVYDEHGEFFTLTEAVIRGEKSPGMLNSLRELGMSEDHGGILILPQDTPLGSKLIEHIPSDVILDVDVLPDRARDCDSHVAIAHEIAALIKQSVQDAEQPASFGLILQILGIAAWKSEIPSTTKQHVIDFNPDSPTRVAGVTISHEEVQDILERLGFVVSPPARGGVGGGGSGDLWAVTVPAARLDILGEHDLIDEVVRVHGLDAILLTEQSFAKPLPVSDRVYWTAQIRRVLVNAGYTETYSYSFEDERFAKFVQSEIHPHIELINPMAPELKKLRYSMLPGLISAMMKNRDDIHRAKNNTERALFEIGRVYHRGDDGVVPGIIERPVIAGIAVGDETTLQEILDTIRELFELEALTVIPAKAGIHPSADGDVDPRVKPEDDKRTKPFSQNNFLKYADEFFGITYTFSDELLKKMKYRMPVVAFEISLNALLKHAPEVEIPIKTLEEIRTEQQTPAQFTELPKYPSVFRDISMLVHPDAGIDAVESEIDRVGGSIVVDVDLFDEFQADGADKKSLAFHIEYRSPEKTLTDKEIAEVHSKIEHALKREFSAEIR